MYHQKGTQALPNTMAEGVYEAIHFNTILISVDPANNTATVINNHRQEKEVIKYDHLISPMPLPDLCKISEGYEHLSKNLHWSSVIIFNIGYKKNTDKFDEISWLYISEPKYKLFRCGWYSHFSPLMAPPGYESMYAEVSYPGNLDGKVQIANIRSCVLDNLLDIGVITNISDIEFLDTIVIEKAYPLPINNKLQTVLKIRNAFEAENIHLVGRYGLWRWTGMYADMKYAEQLFEYIYNKSERPDIYGH